MEQRRFILFISLSMIVFIGWMKFVGPAIFPDAFPQAKQADEDPAGKKRDADAAKKPEEPPADGEQIAQKPNEKEVDVGKKPEPEEKPKPTEPPEAGKEPAEAAESLDPPKHPKKTVVLGSLDPETGYFLDVVLTSKGAAIEEIAFSDPRYKDLKNRQMPLKVIAPAQTNLRTLHTSVDRIDEFLGRLRVPTGLSRLDWEVVETVRDKQFAGKKINSAATFRIVIDTGDGKFEIRKRYELGRVDKQGPELAAARDDDPSGYQLGFDLTLTNLGTREQTVRYALQGPVGVPLENQDNTRKYRDLQMGFLDPDSGRFEVIGSSMTAAAVAKAQKNNDLEQWMKPIKYIGVDVQYFAVLLLPGGDQLTEPYIEVAQPMLIGPPRDALSDVSLTLKSHEIALPPGADKGVTHSYRLYAGPKRQALLEDPGIGATAVLQYGWFGVVAKGMLWLMKFLAGVGIPYGIAIIFMTVIVRGCMYPLSKKQAAGAKKMKELQPKIQELRKKHGNDKEKMARAQMDLFSKHNYNPFAGCLPIFLQLPIFIGLYTALNASIDLRLAPFPLTWIDNLAVPDAMFQLPFRLPFLGTSDFNLLPILTIVLFIAQQKMFMPPPAEGDDQAQMQYKMMNYMMIFMGFLFYKMPAGLCVYFIASSLWGMGERKMLDFGQPKPDDGGGTATSAPVKKIERQAAPGGQKPSNGSPADKRKQNRKSKKSRSRR